ncbi:diguanylate cyclase [Desulfotruncus alcoholivorax]|uniref:diguanylate cyclase n=1 Tax=Desulfotruncus alcoholivorax TaxID=265477 RepID=UPI0003FB8D1B|nr:diguanylate cyclase [Desulfotruncus alcoholivorax]
MINSHANKKYLLAYIAILAGTLIMACLVLRWLLIVSNNIGKISVQENKVADISQIYENVLLQSHYINNYLLTGNPESLQRFRELARTNLVLEDRLIEVIRESRKPLARNVRLLNEKYNRYCEEQVISNMQKGVNLPEEVKGQLFLLEENLRNSVYIIRDMRLADTGEITSAALADSRLAVKLGIIFTLVGLVTGITASLITWRRMFYEYTNYRAILNTTRNAAITVGRSGKITSFNRVAEEIFQIDRSLVLGKKFENVFTGEQSRETIKFVLPVQEVAASGLGRCNQELLYTSSDGWETVLNVDCLPLSHRVPSDVLVIARDITHRKLLEEKLYSMTLRDGLTGLFNHSYIKNSLNNEIKRCREQNRCLAFILLDIDNFKYYNDMFGHQCGDKLLLEFSKVLLSGTRNSDIVGRYGGDEFGIILPGANGERALQVGERLKQLIEEHPFKKKDQLPGGCLTASIGIAIYPDHADNAQELLKLADEAMYHAKRNSKNQVQLYFSAIQEFQRELSHSDRDLMKSLNTLLTIINAKDRYTYAHSEKVAEYAEAIARKLELPGDVIKEIKIAAFLHDIGKLEIPCEILTKQGTLTEQEWQFIKQHPRWGSNMLRSFGQFKNIIPYIEHHHERYDGKGYPDGLVGDSIPLGAQIISLADSFDAMVSQRPYKKHLTFREAILELHKNRGKQFHPVLTGIFIDVLTGDYAQRFGENGHRELPELS